MLGILAGKAQIEDSRSASCVECSRRPSVLESPDLRPIRGTVSSAADHDAHALAFWPHRALFTPWVRAGPYCRPSSRAAGSASCPVPWEFAWSEFLRPSRFQAVDDVANSAAGQGSTDVGGVLGPQVHQPILAMEGGVWVDDQAIVRSGTTTLTRPRRVNATIRQDRSRRWSNVWLGRPTGR